MSPILLFVMLLVLTFGLLFYLLKPTSTEVAVEQRLSAIGGVRPDSGVDSILKKEAFSSNPVIDSLVKQLPFSFGLSKLIRQAGKNWNVAFVLSLSLIGVLGGWWFASLSIPNVLLSLLVGLAVGAGPYIYLLIVREIRFRRFDALLPEAVDLMSRGLRAGHSIGAVLEMVGNEISDPVGVEFRALHKEQTLGLPLRDAMMNLVERMPRDDMRFIATAVLLQKESGGNLAQILDKTAVVVRERARLRGQLRIYTAQGRITGWILGFAPFGMFGLISIFNRNYEKPLFTDPLGIHMIYGALVLMLIGVLLIRKIIDVRV